MFVFLDFGAVLDLGKGSIVWALGAGSSGSDFRWMKEGLLGCCPFGLLLVSSVVYQEGLEIF